MGKKQARQKQTEETLFNESPAEKPAEEISATTWTIASLLIVAGGAILRCYQFGLKPFHHDEGVNGFFMIRLVREGVYTYDPANYHGPSIYYFSLVSSWLFGLNTIAMRLVPALFGIATIWLALTLRRYIGSIGALAAAGLIAISPGAVYLSRYYIHESLFVFFTFGIVVAALYYYETGKLIYAILGAISAALLFATKETAFISIGVILIAWGCTFVYMKIAKAGLPWDKPHETKARKELMNEKSKYKISTNLIINVLFAVAGYILVSWTYYKIISWLSYEGSFFYYRAYWFYWLNWFVPISIILFILKLKKSNDAFTDTLIILAVFHLVYVLFYSSFLTNTKGVMDSFEAFNIWVKTSTKDHTQSGMFAYVKWLGKEEISLLILSAVGFIIALWKARHRFAIFAGAWAFGITLAYTLIAYKTPWLALNFIVPLAIISGYGVGQIGLTSKNIIRQVLAAVVILAALGVGVAQAVSLNFYHYDDDNDYVYVYAHTYRDFLDMVAEFEKYAKKVDKEDLSVAVVSEDYWPLPWYTRDYKGVGYYGKMSPVGNAQIVIASTKQREEEKLDSSIADRFTLVGEYRLRPGVTLLLFVRNDLLTKNQP